MKLKRFSKGVSSPTSFTAKAKLCQALRAIFQRCLLAAQDSCAEMRGCALRLSGCSDQDGAGVLSMEEVGVPWSHPLTGGD